MKIVGIDEVGRGLVIGLMVIVVVVVDENSFLKFEELKVRDFKKLILKRWEKFFNEIFGVLDDYVIFELFFDVIGFREGMFNEFEVENFVKVLNLFKVKFDVIYVDVVDVDEECFVREFGERLNFEVEVVVKYKVDDIFFVVLVVLIFVKVIRDRVVEKFKEEYGEIGFGYLSDLRMRVFFENYYWEYGEFLLIVRKGWKMLKKIVEKVESEKKVEERQVIFDCYFWKV